MANDGKEHHHRRSSIFDVSTNSKRYSNDENLDPRDANDTFFSFQNRLLSLQSFKSFTSLPDIPPPRDTLPTHSRESSPSYIKSSISYPRLSQQPQFYDSQAFWLSLYFSFSLGLTLYNKGVLVYFPFPYTLTAIHALCGSLGGYVLLNRGFYVPAKLSFRDELALFVFSFLYTLNIAVSNISLHLVTVPFHQVVRASTPIFTIILAYTLFGTTCSFGKISSLIPVILGVAFATYGDYYFTHWGLFLTLTGTFLASLKTIFTNVLQSPPLIPPTPPSSNTPSPPPPPTLSSSFTSLLPPRLHLHPLDLLSRMSQLAFIQCIIYAQLTGELERVRGFSRYEMSAGKMGGLVMNGFIAFGLNVVSFTANKKTGPLTMTVAANVKQVLTILLSMMMFHFPITSTNAVGILFTLVGGAWYGAVEYAEKHRLR